MSRGQKKFLYGLFYTIIFGLIIWAFIPPSNVPTPVCSGPSCGTNQPLSLQVSGVPQMFISESTHRVVLLGQVTNPNPDFGAYAFSYDFVIFNRDGRTITSVPGIEKIYPSETKYVLSIYDAGNLDLSLIAERPGFEIKSPSFGPAGNFLKPNLTLTSGPVTQVDPSGVKVFGSLKNNSSPIFGGVGITIILENKYGNAVFAARTLVSNLAQSNDTPFEINFPADQLIIQNTDTSKTEVFLSDQPTLYQ